MEFSTFDAPHDSVGGKCLADFKNANWHNGEIDRHCTFQSINGIYKGKHIKPSQLNGVMYWNYDYPLEAIQLMVRPVAWNKQTM